MKMVPRCYDPFAKRRADRMPETAELGHRKKTSALSRVRSGWCVPQTVRRFGGKLMEQQVWCWGQDVERPDGNLLIEYGFHRYRDRETEDRSTCYRLDQDRLHVALWGFGMFFGRRELGGIYLDRFDFCPKWAPVEALSLAIHWPHELPSFSRPYGDLQWQCAKKLWKLSLLWIAEYENWVRSNVGLAYRRECVAMWLRPFVRADKTSAAWRFLGLQKWNRSDQSPSHLIRRYTIPKGQL